MRGNAHAMLREIAEGQTRVRNERLHEPRNRKYRSAIPRFSLGIGLRLYSSFRRQTRPGREGLRNPFSPLSRAFRQDVLSPSPGLKPTPPYPPLTGLLKKSRYDGDGILPCRRGCRGRIVCDPHRKGEKAGPHGRSDIYVRPTMRPFIDRKAGSHICDPYQTNLPCLLVRGLNASEERAFA